MVNTENSADNEILSLQVTLILTRDSTVSRLIPPLLSGHQFPPLNPRKYQAAKGKELFTPAPVLGLISAIMLLKMF